MLVALLRKQSLTLRKQDEVKEKEGVFTNKQISMYLAIVQDYKFAIFSCSIIHQIKIMNCVQLLRNIFHQVPKENIFVMEYKLLL